jgi:predicted ABC-type ATPase
MYSQSGFRAVARLPFDDKYAPPGWSKETFGEFNGGRPDVVFMVHDPDRAKAYQPGDGVRVASYDDGIKAQKDALDALDRSKTADRIIASVPGARQAVDTAIAKLATGVSSKPTSGVYPPERVAIHKAIVDDMLSPERIAAATPAKGEPPTLHLLGGSGGSGKGWFVRSGRVPSDKAVYLNADDVKAALPEYQGWNAALLHDESSDVLKAAEGAARAGGLNIILDGTMGNMAQLEKRVADYKAAGYRVEGHFMRVSPETSAKRALERFVRGGDTGRYVPPELLLAHNATANFDTAKSDMDTWEMFDNEGRAPKLVGHS